MADCGKEKSKRGIPMIKMTENRSDTPKRKYLVWSDDEEVKVMCGYDWHTNVKEQAVVKAVSCSNGRE
jgi:hypothetical protein